MCEVFVGGDLCLLCLARQPCKYVIPVRLELCSSERGRLSDLCVRAKRREKLTRCTLGMCDQDR